MVSRLLFLCARGSSRALLAASILEELAERHWDVWSTPTQDEQGRILAEQVLHEQGIPLLASDHFIEPTFGMQWDEGIVLCSGAAETGPIIPGAGRHLLWSVEDPPSPDLALEEQVAAYRRLRDALTREIRMKLLLPNLLKLVPPRKGGVRWIAGAGRETRNEMEEWRSDGIR